MSDITITEPRAPVPQEGRSLVCAEVWGGNGPVYRSVAIPGIQGVIYSNPCAGGRGGDVHYLSVCGSGLLSRVCVADVVGHGEMVAAVSSAMHAHLRRSMDIPDQRRVLRELHQRLEEIGLKAMTTAAALTYYAPSRSLTVSYAGHPPGWFLSPVARAVARLEVSSDGRGEPGPVNLPLGTAFPSSYTRRKMRVTHGDRIVFVTDGVLETPGPDGEEFGVTGVQQILEETLDDRCETVADALLSALHRHAATTDLERDDVSFFVGEFVPGPPGPALWHVLRNRVIRRVLPAARL